MHEYSQQTDEESLKKSLKKTTFPEKLNILITNVNISSISKCLPVNLINTEPMVCFLIAKNTVMPCFGRSFHLSGDSQLITAYF